MSPEDAARIGLADGDPVRLTTRRAAADVAPNELTRSEDRDWLAGTPWHKTVPARIERLGADRAI